jgi:hypothetical protein
VSNMRRVEGAIVYQYAIDFISVEKGYHSPVRARFESCFPAIVSVNSVEVMPEGRHCSGPELDRTACRSGKCESAEEEDRFQRACSEWREGRQETKGMGARNKELGGQYGVVQDG